MNRLLLGIIGLVAVAAGGHAGAADLPVKARVYKAPPPVAVYSWTGFYIGGNIGYSWGKADTDVATPGFTVDALIGDLDIPGATFSDSNKLKGIIGGGQIGYNVQTGHWVFGLELDWQASGEKGGATRSAAFDVVEGDCPIFCTFAQGTATTQYEAKILWFGTARGRVGYAADGLLLYGTGGLAYGRVKVTGTNTVTGVVTDCSIIGGCDTDPLAAATAFDRSKVNLGWTLGAGIEGALASMSNWTWKLEYLYLDLGSLDVAAVTPLGAAITTHTRFTDHVIRLGLNLRFGGAVVAKN
jgi:outer membrane immunogenic protein